MKIQIAMRFLVLGVIALVLSGGLTLAEAQEVGNNSDGGTQASVNVTKTVPDERRDRINFAPGQRFTLAYTNNAPTVITGVRSEGDCDMTFFCLNSDGDQEGLPIPLFAGTKFASIGCGSNAARILVECADGCNSCLMSYIP